MELGQIVSRLWVRLTNGLRDRAGIALPGSRILAYTSRFMRSNGLDVSSGSKPEARAQAAHVLLVDDDDYVRETSADMLEELGYQVMRAANGQEALQQLATHPDLAVMVTDVRMPGMSGLELSDVAAAKYRSLKIILMSGYFAPQPIFRRFLRKPFQTVELDEAIRAELACG